MARVELNSDLVEIDGKVRIERGVARKTATATAELLADNVTHPQYAVGQKDSAGNVIVLGQPMQYLDFYAEPGWYVYALAVADDLAGDGVTKDNPCGWDDFDADGKPLRWAHVAYCDSADEADAAAAAALATAATPA